MPVQFRHLELSAAVGLALVFASCDKSPTGPRTPEQGTSSTATTVRLELVAPPEIALLESVQLTANAIKSDGSVENVSSQSLWTTGSLPQLTSTGLATGRNVGEQVVSARFSGLSAADRSFASSPTDGSPPIVARMFGSAGQTYSVKISDGAP